jgi:hypothetical protein
MDNMNPMLRSMLVVVNEMLMMFYRAEQQECAGIQLRDAMTLGKAINDVRRSLVNLEKTCSRIADREYETMNREVESPFGSLSTSELR